MSSGASLTLLAVAVIQDERSDRCDLRSGLPEATVRTARTLRRPLLALPGRLT